MPTLYEENENILPQQHTAIVDSGETHLYIAPNTPHGPLDRSAATIKVGTANGKVTTSGVKATLNIRKLVADLPTTGYIMPLSTNALICVGPICDADCTIVFKKKNVTVLSPEGKPILKGWREKNSKTMALRSKTHWLEYKELHNNSPENSLGTQCLWPAKHRSSSPLYACGSRVPSWIYTA